MCNNQLRNVAATGYNNVYTIHLVYLPIKRDLKRERERERERKYGEIVLIWNSSSPELWGEIPNLEQGTYHDTYRYTASCCISIGVSTIAKIIAEVQLNILKAISH